MSSLREISANVGAFTTVTTSTIENSGDLTTNQFQLIPTVPSLGYTLTSSDDAGNATWTAPLADYPAYVQRAAKINFNSLATGQTPYVVVSSDGGMIVVVYQLLGTLQTQFQTFLYTSGAWVLNSTITTPLTNNATQSVALSDQNDLLALSNSTSEEVVVYRRTAGVWVQVGAMLDLTGTYVNFGIGLVINSGKQMLAVLSNSGVSFYAIGASTLTAAGFLTIASQQTLAISDDFRILVTANPTANTNVGQLAVYVRAALDPLTAWSLLQTVNPYSVSASNVFTGTSVSLSGDGSTLAVGCPGDAVNAPTSVVTTGAVLMFNYVTGVGFVQDQKIIPVDYSYQSVGVNFGVKVQLNFAGDTLVAGGNIDQAQLGSLWVYVQVEGGLWISNGNKYRGTNLTSATANQGKEVAIARGNASVVVSGVPRDTAGNVNAIVIFQ